MEGRRSSQKRTLGSGGSMTHNPDASGFGSSAQFGGSMGSSQEVMTFAFKPPEPRQLLDELLSSSLILDECWNALPESAQSQLRDAPNSVLLLNQLHQQNLITPFQVSRLSYGNTSSLAFGNYRVIEMLGSGAAGRVYKARHALTRRLVAIKVLNAEAGAAHSPATLVRFRNEVRVVAQLQHPHIVQIVDAGELKEPAWGDQTLLYYVMEYVEGTDLEKLVRHQGPLPISKACTLVYQIGAALAKVHERQLVHRDVKPSNVLVTAKDDAKLLDFGLVLQGTNRMTQTGTVLGTVDFLAPEQAMDAASVDIRADIYGLGGVLYWCLTGHVPFPGDESLCAALIRRQQQVAPSVRLQRPEVPTALDYIILKMMANKPQDRFADPDELLSALLPFTEIRQHPQDSGPMVVDSANNNESGAAPARPYRVLVVEDDEMVRKLCVKILSAKGIECIQAADGAEALSILHKESVDLILTDYMMPGIDGIALTKILRKSDLHANQKIIVISSADKDEDIARFFDAGVDDYVVKPFGRLQLQARVQAVLRLKVAQDDCEHRNRRLMLANHQLEKELTLRNQQFVDVQEGLFWALGQYSTLRDMEDESHLQRVRTGCERLAEMASQCDAFSEQVDEEFIRRIGRCSMVHDIGKAGIPDYILLKPGALDDQEFGVLETHAPAGAEFLENLLGHMNWCDADLEMARDIALCHHERFDGSGYPNHISGAEIPLAARIVHLVDSYDSLRMRRMNKPPLSHGAVMKIFLGASQQFDPDLLQLFVDNADFFAGLHQPAGKRGHA